MLQEDWLLAGGVAVGLAELVSDSLTNWIQGDLKLPGWKAVPFLLCRIAFPFAVVMFTVVAMGLCLWDVVRCAWPGRHIVWQAYKEAVRALWKVAE